MRRTYEAIHRGSGYGPRFGWDIYIADNANSTSDSYAGFVWAYAAPAAVQNPNTILTGTLFFSPDEVEVFYLDPTQ